MPCCHNVLNFEVTMSRFSAAIQKNRLDCGTTCTKQAVLLPRRIFNRFEKNGSQLGPSLSLDYREIGLPSLHVTYSISKQCPLRLGPPPCGSGP